MKRQTMIRGSALALSLGLAVAMLTPVIAAEKADPIKDAMKAYHKAPKGVDPVCKKAADGKATAEELKKLVAGYEAMAKATPPRGDAASWKEKTTTLLAAAKGLQKGGPDAAAKYKEALNCKACHSVHKPE